MSHTERYSRDSSSRLWVHSLRCTLRSKQRVKHLPTLGLLLHYETQKQRKERESANEKRKRKIEIKRERERAQREKSERDSFSENNARGALRVLR